MILVPQIDDLQHKLKKLQKAKEEAQESVRSARAQWDTASLDAGSRVIKLQQAHLMQTNEMQEVSDCGFGGRDRTEESLFVS